MIRSLDLAGATAAAHAFRLGLPGTSSAGSVRTLARSATAAGCPFHVKAGASIPDREVGQGELDVCWRCPAPIPVTTRFSLERGHGLVRGPDQGRSGRPCAREPGRSQPDPPPCRGASSAPVAHTIAFTERARQPRLAVGAGLGVMAFPRCVLTEEDLVIWDDGPLPPLPAISAIFACARRGVSSCARAGAADAFAPTALPRRRNCRRHMSAASAGNGGSAPPPI